VITGSSYHAYIKISEGCNLSCSFCAIPSFKGKLHSRTLESMKKEVISLVNQGYYDFSFISQDSSSYGRDIDLRDGLIDLIDTVERIDGVKSARILYLYPSTTTNNLIDKIADSKVFQTYYDMPIQHISNSMLLRMKRGFGKDKTVNLLERMRSKPDSFVRTSIIAGHPNESDDEFKEVCDFMREFNFDRFNVFEYSNEETTLAFNLEQIERDIIESRADTLGDIAHDSTLKSLKNMIGKTIEVVIDGKSDEHEYILSARPLLWAVEIDGDILINDTSEKEIFYGKTYNAKITELAGDRLLATLV